MNYAEKTVGYACSIQRFNGEATAVNAQIKTAAPRKKPIK